MKVGHLAEHTLSMLVELEQLPPRGGRSPGAPILHLVSVVGKVMVCRRKKSTVIVREKKKTGHALPIPKKKMFRTGKKQVMVCRYSTSSIVFGPENKPCFFAGNKCMVDRSGKQWERQAAEAATIGGSLLTPTIRSTALLRFLFLETGGLRSWFVFGCLSH